MKRTTRFVIELSLILAGAWTVQLRGASPTVDSEGTLNIKLGLLGVSPVVLYRGSFLDQIKQIVIDGNDYEGLDGYFPLIKASGLADSFDANDVTFVGLEAREPAVVIQDDGLWLRLLAPEPFSTQLCSLVPDSTVAADYSNTEFSMSRAWEPTGSIWWPSFHEAQVMDTQLTHNVVRGLATATRSWSLTVGRGGQIASLRTPALGETVPPQWRNPNGSYGPDMAPWVDDVWQGVAVDTVIKNATGANWFIHQAGVYLRDPIQKEPFFSPQVAAAVNPVERSFTTINWGQQAHSHLLIDETTENDFQSHLLYFTRFRDLGQAVIEVSLGFYNYGPDRPNHFNMPWGGVRRTSLEYAFLSEPGGTSWNRKSERFGGSDPGSAPYASTGGWIGFCNSETGTTPALGLVFGLDPDPRLPAQPLRSLLRYGYAGGNPTDHETDWRNYYVVSAIRKYDLSQGRGVWARYYFVMGDDVADIAQRISDRQLVEHATLSAFDYTESSTPLVGYRVTGSGPDFRIAETQDDPQFYLYAHPVSGSFPIYEIIENDETRYLTWNPYVTGVVKTYDGTLAGIRLLGFALRTAQVNSARTSYAYEPLTAVMADAIGHYLASGETLSVRTTTSPGVGH